MVLRQYSAAKGLGIIVAFVMVIVIFGAIYVPLIKIASSGPAFGFLTTSDMSSASGINATFKEEGSPRSTNVSELTYHSELVSGQYVFYNSTSNGSFELIELKTSSKVNSSAVYSSYYDSFKSVYKENLSSDKMSSNQSVLGFTYFYFSASGNVHFKVSVGFNEIYMFFLLYTGSSAVNMNNTAEAVLMQM